MSAGRRRSLSLVAFLALVVADVALITVLGLVGGDGDLETAGDVALGLLLPVGGSTLLVLGAVTRLGWWRPVLRDEHPVQRWVWVVPAVFAVAILIGIDYRALADQGAAFVALLLFTALCVGLSEETLFRGIGVTTLRDRGWTEGRVALWSSVIFGAAHLVNALSTGEAAIAQAIAVSFAGYFFLLTRRVSGGLLVPALIHGLFDFSILSASIGDDGFHLGILAPILAYPAVGIVLLVRRRAIELVQTSTGA